MKKTKPTNQPTNQRTNQKKKKKTQQQQKTINKHIIKNLRKKKRVKEETEKLHKRSSSSQKKYPLPNVFPDVHAGNSNCFLNKEGYLGKRNKTGFDSRIKSPYLFNNAKKYVCIFFLFEVFQEIGDTCHLPQGLCRI